MNQPLPQAKEVEASVISAILTAPSCIHNAMQILNDECFYEKSYQNIWKAITHTRKQNNEIDLINISEVLKAKGHLDELGGVLGLMQLTSQFFTSDVTGSCNILKQKYIRRKTITQQYELIKKAFDETNDITNEISKSQNKLNEALSNNQSKECTAHDVKTQIAQHISDNLGKFQEVTGIPTGFESYDKRIGGLSTEGDTIVIAARPGMGKTTFALNVAQNAQKNFGYSGVFFSLEMSKTQIGRILLAQESGVASSDLRKNKVTEMDINYIFDQLAEEPEAKLIINDSSSQLSYIVAEAHKLKRKFDIKYMIVDYLQLIQCEAKASREKEIEHISRTFKILAKTLGIAVIELCQLSRAVEKRGGACRPVLSDLRDSGAIEQDASVVTFIWRPEYYGITETEDGTSLKGVTVLITKKSRFDDIGEDYLFFEPTMCRFLGYDVDSGEKSHVEDYDIGLISMQYMNENSIENFQQRINDQSYETNWNG